MIIRIACLGDSLTYGVGATQGNGVDDYPTQLAEKLTDRMKIAQQQQSPQLQPQPQQYEYKFEIRNFGKIGTPIVVPYRDAYRHTQEFKNALTYQPHIVLLLLGTNDAKMIRRVSLQNLQNEYYNLILTLINNNNDNNNHNNGSRDDHNIDNNNTSTSTTLQQQQQPLLLLPRIILGLPPAVKKAFFGITDEKVHQIYKMLKYAVIANITTSSTSTTATSSTTTTMSTSPSRILLRDHVDYWVDLRNISLPYVESVQKEVSVSNVTIINTTTTTTTTMMIASSTDDDASHGPPLSSQSSFYSKNDGLHLSTFGYKRVADVFADTILCHVDGICKVGEFCWSCPQDCGTCV
jgi:GDSL-like Lipase/Acylhydrolase family